MKCIRFIGKAVLFCFFYVTTLSTAGIAGNLDEKGDYELAGTDISDTFKKFMQCNADMRHHGLCSSDPESDGFLFGWNTALNLQKYHFILLPGGDFDFFEELLGICEGDLSEDLENFLKKKPVMGKEIELLLNNRICPTYNNDPHLYYHMFMGAYDSYLCFMSQYDIPVTRIDFSKSEPTEYYGDRVHKLDLLANTIDAIEEDNGTGMQAQEGYVLIGHSFGGLNISDLLVELLDGHAFGTPEDKLFAGTIVRQWSAEKKHNIFNKIKAVVFLNTFVQGDKSPETRLKQIATEESIQVSDPVEYYIQYVLENYAAGNLPDTQQWNGIRHFVLRSNRYRVNYYLQDKNIATAAPGSSIQNAFNTIAANITVMSVCNVVPRFLPDQQVGHNFIVHKSRANYKNKNGLNDGLVNTYGAIFPRNSTEYVVLENMDHGTLVLKPKVLGITTGYSYDQVPFIKTLLKRLEYRISNRQ